MLLTKIKTKIRYIPYFLLAAMPILAQESGGGEGIPPPQGMFGNNYLFIMIAMCAVIYFAVIRPEQKKKHKIDRAFACKINGDTCNKEGDLDQAIVHYEEAIKLLPEVYSSTVAEIKLKLGKLYAKKGNSKQAILEYGNSIQLNPKVTGDDRIDTAYFCRGCLYDEMGDIDSAIADYIETVKITPDYLFAWQKLRDAYAKKGDTIKALETAIKCKEVHEKIVEAFDKAAADFKAAGGY
jgi:tetratricopeptide (TPR) repeat protein